MQTQRNQLQTSQLFPCWLASIMPGDVIQASKRKKTKWSYLALGPAHCHSHKIYLLVQRWHEGHGGNQLLSVGYRPASQEVFHFWCCKPCQKSMTCDTIGPRGGKPTVALPNGRTVNLNYKYLWYHIDFCYSQLWSEKLLFVLGNGQHRLIIDSSVKYV